MSIWHVRLSLPRKPLSYIPSLKRESANALVQANNMIDTTSSEVFTSSSWSGCRNKLSDLLIIDRIYYESLGSVQMASDINNIILVFKNYGDIDINYCF
jgi:hypothetical protein